MPKIPDENSSPLPVTEEPSRRPILDYFQMAAASERFWRIFSSREKMIEGMKTLAWVVPLTLLIWIYAVREQVVQPNSPNAFHIFVNLKSTDPSLYVEFDGQGTPYQRTVDLQLTGPQQNLEQVKESLVAITAGQPQGVTIDLRSDLGIGDHQPLNVVDRIQNNDVFKYNGVTVQQSVPEILYVNVDKRGRVPGVPVLAKPNVPNLAPESKFDPPTVTVSGPAKLLKALADTGQLKVYAGLDGYAQKLKEPGAKTIPSVPLEFASPQEKLKMSANEVTANLVVTPSDVPYPIPYSVPVYVRCPSDFIGKFDPVLDASEHSLANINVTGPQQAINAIIDKSFQVQATLQLVPDDQDILNTRTPRTPAYTLPDGVHVTPTDLARQVHFTLVPRPQ